MWFFWCFLRLWATANYCRAGIKSLRGTGTETPKFLFWEYLFRNFGILSLQCGSISLENFWVTHSRRKYNSKKIILKNIFLGVSKVTILNFLNSNSNLNPFLKLSIICFIVLLNISLNKKNPRSAKSL